MNSKLATVVVAELELDRMGNVLESHPRGLELDSVRWKGA